MKKMVLRVSIEDEKCKRRVMQTVAGIDGVEFVGVDMKEKKVNVIGKADPVEVAKKLRIYVCAEMLSVGPAEEEKKEESKKKKEKKAEPPRIVYVNPGRYGLYPYSIC